MEALLVGPGTPLIILGFIMLAIAAYEETRRHRQ